MRRSSETVVTVRSTLGIVTFVLLSIGWVTSGCSIAGERVLPGQLETQLASNGTADDHLTAALLYQKEAQRAQAEVNKYTQAAAAIRPIEDPKGLRRSALITAAQEQQKYAGEMQQLYAVHQTKAETMMGKQQPQY
jgi:hypothetical protein